MCASLSYNNTFCSQKTKNKTKNKTNKQTHTQTNNNLYPDNAIKQRGKINSYAYVCSTMGIENT